MSLKNWLNNISEDWFGYRAFFARLIEYGKEDIYTKEDDENDQNNIILLTTLYLDGDMQFSFHLPEGASYNDITEQLKKEHLDKVSKKVAHINKFFNQVKGLIAFLAVGLPWAINYGPQLLNFNALADQVYSIYGSAILSTGAVAFRKSVVPFMIRQVAGKILRIRLKGISLNKNVGAAAY